MVGAGGLLDEHDEAAMQGRRVLLVDDESDILGSVSRLLEASYPGLTVEGAARADIALDMIAKTSKPYDIIVSDYRMPGMNGIEFLEQCREVCPDSYRVMMTAYPDREVSRDAVEIAAVETFLAKPLDPGSILLNIKELLRQRWLDSATG